MKKVSRHRFALAIRDWGKFLPEHTTAVSLLDRLFTTASSWPPRVSRSGSRRLVSEEVSKLT